MGLQSERSLTEGERWARELLDTLRARRFTPLAWRDFLSESLARARRTRARRPDVVAQSRRWCAVGVAAAVPFGAVPTGWAVVWGAMIDWHLGMLETADGRSRRLAAADAFTLARLWAAPVVRRHPRTPLVVALLATDLVDGMLARHSGPTRFGRDFDGAADAALFLALMRAAADRDAVAPWIPAMERGRQVIAGALGIATYFGASRPLEALHTRQAAAALAAAGALLATAGRRRAAQPLLAAAIGYRTMIRLRSV
jgi:phosphatidylglycerophosphate synthase